VRETQEVVGCESREVKRKVLTRSLRRDIERTPHNRRIGGELAHRHRNDRRAHTSSELFTWQHISFVQLIRQSRRIEE